MSETHPKKITVKEVITKLLKERYNQENEK